MKISVDYPTPKAERHATLLAHDDRNCRVVLFALAPAQEVPLHTSTSTVVVTVTGGSGRFAGAGSDAPLSTGATVAYAPGEAHSMTAGPDGLRFVAVIAPSPS